MSNIKSSERGKQKNYEIPAKPQTPQLQPSPPPKNPPPPPPPANPKK